MTWFHHVVESFYTSDGEPRVWSVHRTEAAAQSEIDRQSRSIKRGHGNAAYFPGRIEAAEEKHEKGSFGPHRAEEIEEFQASR